MSNSIDPDQTWRFVRPDVSPNCLQRLSADDEISPLAYGKSYNNYRDRNIATLKNVEFLHFGNA